MALGCSALVRAAGAMRAARWLVATGAGAKAKAGQFEALSRLSPESPAPHEALGNVYRAIGLMDLAAAEYQRALALSYEP